MKSYGIAASRSIIGPSPPRLGKLVIEYSNDNKAGRFAGIDVAQAIKQAMRESHAT